MVCSSGGELEERDGGHIDLMMSQLPALTSCPPASREHLETQVHAQIRERSYRPLLPLNSPTVSSQS